MVGGQVVGDRCYSPDFRNRLEAVPNHASVAGIPLCPPSHAVEVVDA